MDLIGCSPASDPNNEWIHYVPVVLLVLGLIFVTKKYRRWGVFKSLLFLFVIASLTYWVAIAISYISPSFCVE